MSGRTFALPNIQDLTKEQERVRNLPLEGQHLIVGGPGTGKSVVALLRATRLANSGKDYRFLVYNHLLHRATCQLFQGTSKTPNEELRSATWNDWLNDEFKTITGQALPRKEAAQGSSWRPVDWGRALAVASEQPSASKEPAEDRYLVIDEGQDMPPEFYECVDALGFENLFVVADQNQQITEENSSRQQLEHALGLETGEVHKLRHNFRNKYPIARLAQEFCTKDPASPPPDLPEKPPSGYKVSTPILFKYDLPQLHRIAKRILKQYDVNPNHLIGVIAPNNAVREQFLSVLRDAAGDPRRTGSPPQIETFAGRYRPDVRFDMGGILIINVQACKGLEFDRVFGADLDAHYLNPADPDSLRKRLYVMVARAREQVILLIRQDGNDRVEDILPRDEDVLQWWPRKEG